MEAIDDGRRPRKLNRGCDLALPLLKQMAMLLTNDAHGFSRLEKSLLDAAAKRLEDAALLEPNNERIKDLQARAAGKSSTAPDGP